MARKDKYALLAMAICDASRRFTWYDISQTPNTHDSLAFSLTDLGIQIKDGHLPSPFFINADAAFSASNSIITPSGESALDDFDFHQSGNRVAIECAFGILVRRFPILWRPLQVKFSRCAAIIGACMHLHNFCIDHNVSEDTVVSEGGISKVQPARWAMAPLFDRDGRPVEYLASVLCDTERSRAALRSDVVLKRNELAAAVRECGVVRPPLGPGQVPKKRRR